MGMLYWDSTLLVLIKKRIGVLTNAKGVWTGMEKC